MPSSAQVILQQAIQQGLTICMDANSIIYYFSDEQPWADRLRPVFEAGDQGRVQLITSTVTLAEVLASGQQGNVNQDELATAVRRYFDIIPVSDQTSLFAANIRQGTSIKAADALQAAVTANGGAALFITNDERLSEATPQGCAAIYISDLVLGWLADEFDACVDLTAPVVAVPPGQLTLNLDVVLSDAVLLPLVTPLPASEFPLLAMKLAHLVAGPAAVVGVVEGEPGVNEQLVALRLLPSGRPWATPSLPDWVKQYTGKNHSLSEYEPKVFVESALEQLARFNQSHRDRGSAIRRTLHLMADISRADAQAAVDAMNRDGRMKAHKQRSEHMKRYLSPFNPLARLWEVEHVQLWSGEAGNARRLDLSRFRAFHRQVEKVLGKAGVV